MVKAKIRRMPLNANAVSGPVIEWEPEACDATNFIVNWSSLADTDEAERDIETQGQPRIENRGSR